MIKRMIIMCVGLVILFGVVFGYKAIKGQAIAAAVKANQNPIITVSSGTAKAVVWQNKIQAVGSTRSVNGVEVTTQLGGMIVKLPVVSGSMIKKGDLIAQLNIQPDLDLLKKLKAEAKYAKITYFRNIKQNRIGAISDETLAQNRSDYLSTEAAVKEQEATIDKKIIRAPFSGKLGICTVNVGQYLSPGDKIVPLQTISPIFVDFYLPQQDLSKVKMNQSVTVTTDAFADKTFKGVITAINPQVEEDSRNVKVEATLQNKRMLLLPGIFVNVDLSLGTQQTYITIPLTAIHFTSYGNIVYTLDKTQQTKEGKAVWQAIQNFVTVGPSRGNQVAILKGLKAGDTIVTTGGFKLKNKSLVYINNAVEPLSNPFPKVKEEFQ